MLSGDAEAQVQLLLDGSDSNTAAIAQGYAEGIVQTYAARLRGERKTCTPDEIPPVGVSAESRVWYNPDMVSRNFIVPGLIAVIMMIITGNLSSLTIAREWENGTMEQLAVNARAPFRTGAGQTGRLLSGGTDRHGDLHVRRRVFVRRAVQGEPAVPDDFQLRLPVRIVVYRRLGLGNVPHATDGLPDGNTDLVPAGLPAFRIYLFHQQHAARDPGHRTVRPARYFINISKGVFLKGIGPEILWPDFLLLCGYGALIFFFTVRKLRQKVA